MFIPSATSRGLSEYLWRIEQPSHAVANGYYVGTINRVGIEADYGDDDFYGQSYFVDPRGQFVGEVGDAHEEELIVRDLDMDKIMEVRNTWQFYRDRRPDAYADLTRPVVRATIPPARPSGGGRPSRFIPGAGGRDMQFGFTLKPDHTLERTLALTRQAEAAGFDYGWLFDSHVLWREPYVLLTLMAQATTRLRLGTCVTNPATREPSVTASALAVLDEISGGRMDLGIGRGDSARRVLGKPPTTMATLEEAIVVIKALVEGRAIDYEGAELHLPWTGKWTLPVWVAGYGPMALAMTGRIADGIILQLADPDLIRWFVGQVREAAAAAGRDPSSIMVQAAAAGPRRPARARSRADPLVPGARLEPRRRPRQQVPARAAPGQPDRLHPGPIGLRLPAPRRGRLVECGLRRRRGDRPVLRPGTGRRARRQAPRAGRRRRRPVQHLPHERRRGGPTRGVRT